MATSALPSPYTPKVACINFGMWGRVLDAINHAKFQLDRFRGFGAPGGRKPLFPIDWRYRPYNVLHCDVTKRRDHRTDCLQQSLNSPRVSHCRSLERVPRAWSGRCITPIIKSVLRTWNTTRFCDYPTSLCRSSGVGVCRRQR